MSFTGRKICGSFIHWVISYPSAAVRIDTWVARHIRSRLALGIRACELRGGPSGPNTERAHSQPMESYTIPTYND